MLNLPLAAVPSLKRLSNVERTSNSKSGTLSYVIKNGWKLQVDEQQDKKWLFDLNTDPTEQNNLVDTETEKLAELSKLRQELLAEQIQPIWKGAMKSPIPMDKHLKEKFTKEDEYAYWTN